MISKLCSNSPSKLFQLLSAWGASNSPFQLPSYKELEGLEGAPPWREVGSQKNSERYNRNPRRPRRGALRNLTEPFGR
jgi:hypothetical protein